MAQALQQFAEVHLFNSTARYRANFTSRANASKLVLIKSLGVAELRDEISKLNVQNLCLCVFATPEPARGKPSKGRWLVFARSRSVPTFVGITKFILAQQQRQTLVNGLTKESEFIV
ncbi:hypothetical protein SAMD00079811_00590 [Scytonema sp. HK-05]|uniref:hypothetical protein n=1 Tax=Scytonema sp. HK-05 TaxID=1137095 RepID=UPI0009378ECA|nr:hypothetical protein [Scytonema sp. HK-05]OKH57418.1 hypothetical protein NIES2130_20055 [Scytonema sp. HK-05]BAY42482.1 hypothetical protein SAMD00079811_00590 [Scytonema sp. HK-05]